MTVKNRLLAKFLIAGSIFLCSTGNAFAAANLTSSSASFTSADLARTNSYMDRGGVWNGVTEVSNVGDTFTLTIANTATGVPDVPTDTAFNLQDIIVTVDAGFLLASGTLNINNVVGTPTCPNISVGAAQQPGGAGTSVTLNIGANEDVLPGCSYELSFGLTTTNTVTVGAHPLNYDINYDDNLNTPVNVPVAQSIDVRAGTLSITKTTAATSAISGSTITYNITVNSTGSGGLFDVRLNDVLSSDLSGLTFTVPNPPPGANVPPGSADYIFEYLAAGESVNLTVDATVGPVLQACPILDNSANLSERTGVSSDSVGPVNVPFDFQLTSGSSSNVISHGVSSYCELCGDGTVTITVQNPTTAPLTNITLREDLQASGLVYIPGSTTINTSPVIDPSISGNILTWNLPDLAASPANHVITFRVRSAVAENLITAVRDVIATVDFKLSCLAATQSVNTGQFEIPIRQPEPQVLKDGRNVDAGQGGYSDPVFGNQNDDVIWRVNVQNAGQANMEALRMNDTINGNFSINFICPTQASAVTTALTNNGSSGGPGCIAMTSPFNVADPFGNAPDPDDIGAGTTNAFIYYVGRILAAHTNNTNSADISWGCAVDSPTGGLITVPASNGGFPPPVVIAETGDLNTTVVPANLQITQTVTGSNTGQPLGSKGLVTVTINNQTGGTIKNIQLKNVVPNGYVVDGTFGSQAAPADCDCTVTYTPAYGATYPGFIDTVLRDDPQRIDGDPLTDTNPSFTFTSSVTGADANQVDLLRNGDVVTLTFGIVMVDPSRFDKVADLDVAPENTTDGTDPVNALALTSSAAVNFDAADLAGVQNQTQNNDLNFNSNPEDLDVVITDALFILTNDPGTPLLLDVDVTNNGGHDADDYTVYITLGQAMTAQLPLPAGCTAVTPPAPPNVAIQPLWNQPAYLPSTAAVFACDRGTIAPGATETITFSVIKTASSGVDDDLTFRVDVVGEITQFDTTPLAFPAPVSLPNTTPNQQLANNYTLDAVRSRVLGFNLTKSVLSCAEGADFEIQVGEDCTYHIEAGGWFGFLTPGFTLIAVENVAVTDDLPNNAGLFGQGFIPYGGTPYVFNNTTNISFIDGPGGTGGATTTPLDANDITWRFNTSGSGIVIKDEFFRVDLKTRLLNNPVDLAYPVPGGYAPNLHGNTSLNVARTSFDAVFNSVSGNTTIIVNDSAGIPGYPALGVRTVGLTEVEPNLIVTKQVCNESLSITGTGPSCTPFLDTVNNGDTNDLYVFRITLTNDTTSPVVRSPAYNIISTDTLDASGLMLVNDLMTDGLDNDGDGFIDAADTNGEGTITGNTIGVPAVITFDESNSLPLLQVDSGTTVTFYYRVDPDQTIAPLQSLINTVSMRYDSLKGDFGNQNVPQIPNTGTPTSGRARIYTSIDQTADVIMIPLLAQPKTVIRLSNTTLAAAPHDVVVGEEVEYQLTAQLPVANLKQFKIRDELPAGIRCIEGQVIDLGAPPYDAAGFFPGGVFTSTCTSTGVNDIVEWHFTDQAVTQGAAGSRFSFPVTFIARVENTAVTTEGVTITNGGGLGVDPADCTGGVGVCYVNDQNTAVSLDFGPVTITVREPAITLTKSFLPVTNSDAADELTVTVTATNNGTAAAYNLQLLDNLVGSDLTYIVGSEAGVGNNKPDSVDISIPNRPVFSWNRATNPDYAIAPGAVITFTFKVRVDTTAQPLKILDNTIQAKWDSLPGQNVALNGSGLIGPNGTAMGLRNGAVPNTATAPNIYETIASASTSVLPLVTTKTDLNPAVIPTIGAHRKFEVVVDLPEGTTKNLIVDDVLATGASGVSYMLSRNASFEVSYQFIDIVSINGSTTLNESVFNGATAGTLPGDGNTGTITWDIGTVITEEEDDLVVNNFNPRIIITYYARPNNDLITNVGDTLQNSATSRYRNGEDGTTAATPSVTTAVQTVVEPLLAISKAVSNVTNNGVGPVAGDVLEYQITINNTGNSTAFDSNIVDTLDDNLLFDASVLATPTALLDGVAVSGFIATPSITPAPASTFTWGRANGDNTLDIPVGSTLVLTYRVIVQNTIEANVVISNSALVDWTSLDDADLSNAFERTGADCLVGSAGFNDYCSLPAVANITANDSNSIVKTVIGDTYDNPTDGIVRVGDTVTYQLAINIQQGTTRDVNILDAVPAGLTFVDIVSINGDTVADYDPPTSGVGSNFSYATILAANVPAAGDITPAFNWNIGTVTNDAAGDPTTDIFVIKYRARVTENILPQSNTMPLINTANLSYMDGNNSPSSPPGSSATITVLQPIMDSLTKVDRSGRPNGSTVNVATDVMEFRLHSCNTTGLAPAYGLLMTDALPTQMNEATLTGPVNGALAPDVLINGTPAIAGTDYVYTSPASRGGNMVFRFNKPIDPGVCVDIDFNMGFYTDFPANQTWSNSLTLNEYYSLPPANAQLYPAIGPVTFDMNNNIGTFPLPEKTMLTPLPTSPEATIGDDVIYQIKVPATPANAIMYDVTVTDTLANSLIYVSASAKDALNNNVPLTDNTALPGSVNLVIASIPAGQQAIIELRARVDNTLTANAGNNFGNTATYRFANSPNGTQNFGGTDSTASTLSITEPAVVVTKSVTNTTKAGPPDAGDILRYTVTLTAAGGAAAPADFNSDAFDLIIDDSLSLGLAYVSGSETVNGGNTINPPLIVGDGINTAQSLSWSPANADNIDVAEGTVVTVTYDVLVLDSVLANQNLSNSVDIQWSSRDGPDANQRDGSGVPPLNDYFNLGSAVTLQTTPDNNVISKTRITDTYNPADNSVRIGDIVEYELRINMQEGTSPNFIVRDDLPQGLAFEQTVSINGQTVAPYPAVLPFSHAAIPAAVVVGDPAIGSTTVTWSAGDVINTGDNNITNDDFVIVYRARVLNLVHPQQNNIPVPNTVNFDYDMAGGPAPSKTGNEMLDLQQPDLSITKTSLPVGGSVIGAGDVVTYTVQISNGGTTAAYDTELLDTIPSGLRSPAITMVSMTLLSGTPLPGVLPPVYNPATGTASWNFDTGTANAYNIPAGDTLQIVYQVQADAGLGTGLTLTNSALIQFYYSFDNNAVPTLGGINGVREIYGPSNPAQVTLTTTPANPLLKINPADLNASIGETFTYRITIPAVPQTTALYDVQILDDLVAGSAADLKFVSAAKISGSQTFTPANIGTVADNLIIADVTNGIDIPANEQVVIDITVTLRDSLSPNVAPLPFSNTASYTFNQIKGDNSTVSNGSGNTTPLMTVVEPDLTLDKRGPTGTVNFLAPIPYTLVVENIGTGPSFDSTIVDRLPFVPDNPPLTGGTCDTTPINIIARITTSADESTVVRALTQGTDYTAIHTAAPTCELVITTLSNAARIEASEKLIVSYETTLDVATQSGALLTNIAGVTQWFSLDTAGAGATGETRTYTRTITDGTPTVTDHQDAFTVTVEAPVLDFQKTVFNKTTGLPGTDASPGDTLRYSITVKNIGPTPLANFSLTDEVDGMAPASGFFAGSTMTNFVIPAGADNSNTNIAGGANGAGLLDVRNLSIGAAGGANDTLLIQFEVTLLPAIDSGTVVLNQAQINSPSTGVLYSDDPALPGVADPTPTLITSAPAFLVQKTSQDISGDPAVLLPGDILRYTLTVKNIGQENAINSLLRDQIPANTSYVASSTRLNGVIVVDPAAAVSPLAAGMLINAPENTTVGFLRADTSATANNVASITFDVVVSPTAVNGTLISNQGFFSGSGAGSGVFPQQPSDDPGTALVDDPTVDVVGNVPVIDALKTVAIQNDLNSNGVVDPGDTLRYTITTTNIGALPANNVVLTDAVPADTTYVANSTTLNTLAVPDAGAGISPLIAGIAMSSADLTPPLPAAGNGVLSPANSAIVTFDVVVNAGTAPGTIISNQGFIASNELPTEPTDADGNGANGNQPTVVVVGNVQQLTITKQVFVIGGGAAEPGNQLEYVVRVTNIGGITATNVVITDDMDLPAAGQKTYVVGSGLLDGLPAGVSFTGSVLTATIGNMPTAAVAELRFRVTLSTSLNIGDTIINTADVTWDAGSKTASASVSIDIGGTPGSANLNGQVWHDTDFNNNVGADELLLPDYRVELYRNNTLLGSTVTDANGVFLFSGLPPNLPTGDAYELRYFAPGATATTAPLGDTNSAFTDGEQRITNIFAASGTNVQNLNLPRQVNGVVYDSVLRVPVAGVRLTMINQTRSNQPVPASCFDDPIQASQVTQANGYYKFDLNFSDPARCASGDEYEIQVLPPAGDFTGTTSVIIPPVEPVTGVAQNVPSCPGTSADKIPATALHCENSVSQRPPPASIAPRTPGTDYYLKFQFNTANFTGQIYNNHIPVDGILEAAVAISKVASKLNVTRSDLVPYTITFNNTLGVPLFGVSIIDNFPAGFKYVTSSARVDGVAIEPQINGRLLTWPNLRVDINESRVIKLLLIVGSGVGEGEYVNTARAIDSFTNQPVSGVASATVRVIPDPTFDCSDVIGKVFDDKNLNTYQDEGEKGIPGVQVATARGLRVTTDSHGRFHITCAVVANEVRGSNFILKLDERTLPSGYRVTTENPRVQRATRGKMLKFNFGTAIHRVVRLDLADGVFEKGKTVLRPQWRSRIDMLITELQKEGSILRLSYLAENETEDEVDDRLDAIEDLVSDRWEDLDCCYKLVIEKEVFWRKGSPSAGREFK